MGGLFEDHSALCGPGSWIPNSGHKQDGGVCFRDPAKGSLSSSHRRKEPDCTALPTKSRREALRTFKTNGLLLMSHVSRFPKTKSQSHCYNID